MVTFEGGNITECSYRGVWNNLPKYHFKPQDTKELSVMFPTTKSPSVILNGFPLPWPGFCITCRNSHSSVISSAGIFFKGEVRSWSNLISEERVKFSEQNSENLMKSLKNKEVMKFWSFANFQETFLDQSVWICKWVSWWCHRLTIFHSFCTQKWQKFHISAMRMLDLP